MRSRAESQARSLPEVSLSAFFERRWPSVYQALQDGRINVTRLREVFVRALIGDTGTDEPIWVGIVSRSRQRLEAEHSPERGMIYVPNLPPATTPVSVGGQFATVMLLPEAPSSWVGLLEQRRIRTEQTASAVGIEQVRALLALIDRPVIVLADRWYGVVRFVQACREVGCSALIRLKGNRKLSRPAPPRQPQQRGAPCTQGPLFQGTRPETSGPADAEWEGTDEQGKRVLVSCWQHVHFQQAPQVEVTGVRVQREAARDSQRDPRASWFIWLGQQEIPLEQVRHWSRKRFSQEPGSRFLKQDLLWTQAHLRTPEQVDRWRWIVACACNQLLLAQPLGLSSLRPWESKQRPVTPRQVRRVMPSPLVQFGTPARRPKPRGKAPGWPTGRVRTPTPRFAVVKKTKPVPKKRRKRA